MFIQGLPPPKAGHSGTVGEHSFLNWLGEDVNGLESTDSHLVGALIPTKHWASVSNVTDSRLIVQTIP